MSAEERENLHDLYVAARDAWSRANLHAVSWPEAYKADDAFTQALYAVEVTP